MMSSTIAQAATGKWPAILQTFGVDPKYLRNSHGPCPLCAGRDRYRFDNKDGRGTFFCSQCGAGDGFDLLQKINQWNFKEAANRVQKIIGTIVAEPEPKADSSNKYERLKRIHTGLKRISPGDPVSQYLQNRGITVFPSNDVFYHPAIDYWHRTDDNKPVKIGTFPAMVASIRNLNGELSSYHVTYIQDGKKIDGYPAKKILPVIRPMTGAAIRIGGVHHHVGIAEGVETALAVMQLYQIPCWSTINANGMERLELPKGIKKVTIFADEDSSFTGQAAAYALAKRLKVREGKDVEIARILGRDKSIHFDQGSDMDHAELISKK